MTFVKSADDKLWEGEGLVPDLPRVRAPVHQRAETGMQNARVYGVPKAYAGRTSPAMTDVHAQSGGSVHQDWIGGFLRIKLHS